MQRALPLGLVLGQLLVLGLARPAQADDVDLPRFPSIAPNGDHVAFSWRGDLWRVAAGGGDATRLTRHTSSDLRSAWSVDGGWIAFDSRRAGPLNLYVMRPDGSELREVTRSDRDLVLSGWAPRGGSLLAHGRLEGDVYRASRPYAVPLAGGEPARLMDAFGHSCAISPDGERVAFVRGESAWSRRGYRGSDARELWLYELATARYTRLSRWAGNDGRPRWRGNDQLVFMSDRELGAVNLYTYDLGSESEGEPPVQRLTSFGDRDVLAFDVAARSGRIVLLAWDTLYLLDAGDEPRPLEVRAPSDAGDGFRLESAGGQVAEAALSPDGKALAFVARGEVFVQGMGEKSPTRRVTRTHAREREIAWSPDGERLYFVSDRGGSESIYAARVVKTRAEVKRAYARATSTPSEAKDPPGAGRKVPWWTAEAAGEAGGEGSAEVQRPEAGSKEGEEPSPGERWAEGLGFETSGVVTASSHERDPSPSPDGKTLAFRRRGDLVLLDLSSGAERVFRHGWDRSIHWRWSPDSRYLAYVVQDRNFNSDVWIEPVDGSRAAVNVSMHPDEDRSPRWSADGKVLAFLSAREQDQAGVWMVYLDAELEALGAEELARYYEEASKAAKARELSKPEKEGAAGEGPGAAQEVPGEPRPLDLDRAYLRLRRVTGWPGSEDQLELAPGGDLVVVSSGEGEEAALYTVRWDGTDKKRIYGKGRVQQLSFSGTTLVALQDGRVTTVPLDGGQVENHAPSATLRVERAMESSQKFLEAARILAESFYHPTMKGRDWPALTERYHQLAQRAHTADEFRDVASRLIGELNASHLGIYPPPEQAPGFQEQGRLGIDRRRVGAAYRVEGVVPLGPADGRPMKLERGDRILTIDGEPFAPTDTLELRLTGRVGQETLVGIERARDGQDEAARLELLLTPISYGAEASLRYQAWERDNARKVGEWSGGRVGYLHIRGMNQPSLVEFERDLYAAANGKEGLLIDVRNNGGGWTADRVLASLMVRPHAFTVPRGADPEFTRGYPQGRLYIQRYTQPANMLCNEKSFSNAEILSHAFKTLGRGRLVGQATYGGVISTGAATLVDGTRVRVPFRGWYLPDGTDMENNGAQPDLLVDQTPDDEASGTDRQLRVAVDDLLRRLPY